MTPSGDIRGDVAFQNDVNPLLARLDRWVVPWAAMPDDTPAPNDQADAA